MAGASDFGEASGWLAASRDGYCGVTTGPGDCKTSSKGRWPLDPRDTEGGWRMAVGACRALCHGCERCKTISVSHRWGDYSWFSNCPHLKVDVAGFLSAAVLANASGTPRSCEEYLSSIRLICSCTPAIGSIR